MATKIEALKNLDGFIAASLVDSGSGMMLESLTAVNFPIELASAANTEVLQSKLKAMKMIGLGNDGIEDILITLTSQYHLLRPLATNPEIFIYIALDRSKSNLALARMEVKKIEGGIKF